MKPKRTHCAGPWAGQRGLAQLREEHLGWLTSQEFISINPATGKWRVRNADATDYPRPKTETVRLGHLHSNSGMRVGHGLSLLCERVREGSRTLPLEIGWIQLKSNPLKTAVVTVVISD
jgi:hypothetical protein